MATQHKTKLTREGKYYLIVLFCILCGAVMREVNLLFVLAGMLTGPLLLSLRTFTVTLRGLRVSRTVPRGIYAGEPFVVDVQLQNSRRRAGSFAVVVEDHISLEATPIAAHQVFFPYVAKGKSRKGAYHGCVQHRGRYILGPMLISTRFPFGLLRREISVDETDSILIYPHMGRLTRRWAARQHESFEGGHWRRQRYHRAEGEYYGVREWRDGDSHRSIHWRTSARLGQLVVRQYEQPHTRDIALLIDLYCPKNATENDLQRVERVVSFSATVISDVCRQGNANLLLAISGKEQQPLSGPASASFLQEAMTQLAVCTADKHNRLHAMLKNTIDEIDSSTEVVLISTRLPDLMGNRRMAGLWNSTPRRSLLRRTRIVSDADGGTGDDHEGKDLAAAARHLSSAVGSVNRLSQYFQL